MMLPFFATGAFLTALVGAALATAATLATTAALGAGTVFFVTAFFTFFSSAPSLYDAFTFTNLPASAPLLSAPRSRC